MAPYGNRFKVLGTHYGACATPSGSIFETGHNAGKPDHIFAGRTYETGCYLVIIIISPYSILCFFCIFAPEVTGVFNTYFLVRDVEVDGSVGFSFYYQGIVAGPLKFAGPETACLRFYDIIPKW